MAKTSFSDWDTTAANNTDLDSIPLGENLMFPANVNNAFREVMAQLKSGVQPLDADLTAIAALAKTDGNVIVGNGTAWVAENGQTARTSLGFSSTSTNNAAVRFDGTTGATQDSSFIIADSGTSATMACLLDGVEGNSIVLRHNTSSEAIGDQGGRFVSNYQGIDAASFYAETAATWDFATQEAKAIIAVANPSVVDPVQALSVSKDGIEFLNGAGRIKFPSTPNDSSDANTLDDYEEGTFTPTIVGTTTAGTGTYSTQIGEYTKIGNRVIFNIEITWSAHTGTGDMRVSGLPFTPASGRNVAVSVWPSAVTFSSSGVVGYIGGSLDRIILNTPVSNAASSATPISIEAAGTLFISGMYRV